MAELQSYAILDEEGKVYDIRKFDPDNLPSHKPGRVKLLEDAPIPRFDPTVEYVMPGDTPEDFQVQDEKVIRNFKVIEHTPDVRDRITLLEYTLDLTDPNSGKTKTITVRDLFKLLGFG